MKGPFELGQRVRVEGYDCQGYWVEGKGVVVSVPDRAIAGCVWVRVGDRLTDRCVAYSAIVAKLKKVKPPREYWVLVAGDRRMIFEEEKYALSEQMYWSNAEVFAVKEVRPKK